MNNMGMDMDMDMDCPPPPAHVQPHGLLNQGSTCYLNSVLQVLFMTRDFREGVQRHAHENPYTGWIDRPLKDLFDDLQRGAAYTCNVTNKLGIDNVHEQRDAAEYFEKILSLTNPDASQIFHGKCTHRTTCSQCRACSDADGYFWHLPLDLLDSYSEDYSVVDGLEQYFQTSYFDGEDQMYCDQCEAKCDATTKCVMKHHPEVLTLLLKRFDFDYSYMRYVKNNRAVDVPSILHIPENQTYELYALVEHFGDLRSGHYTATVKSPDDERWYNFNDAHVTLVSCPPIQGNIVGKFSSVYLLFYKKTKSRVAETCTHGIIAYGSAGEAEEGETRTEVGDDDTAEDTSMDVDQPKRRVEDQDNNDQGWNDESNARTETPKQDEKDIKVKDDQEGGQIEAEEQAAPRERFLTNDQLRGRLEGQDFGEAGKTDTPGINQEFEPETSDSHDHLNKDDEMSEKRGEGSVPDAHTENQTGGNTLTDGEDGGHTGADEQVEQSRVEDQDIGDTGNNGDKSSDRSATRNHRNEGGEMSQESVKDQDSNDEGAQLHGCDLEALKQHEVNILKGDEEGGQTEAEEQEAPRERFLTNNQFELETSDSHGSVNKEVPDAHTENQTGENTLTVGEYGGHTGADEQVEQSRVEDQDIGDKHEFESSEMNEESVKDQDSRNLEASKQHEVNILKGDEEGGQTEAEEEDFSSAQTDVCKEDEMRDVQQGVLNMTMHGVESSQCDGEETKEKSSLENLVEDTQNQTSEGLDSVRKDLDRDQENKQEQVQLVSLDKKVDKEVKDRTTGAHQQTTMKRQHCYPTVGEDKRRELDDEDDHRGMTGGDTQPTESKALLTKYDLYLESYQYSTALSDRNEQQRQESGDSSRDDERAQRKETSTTKHDLCASLGDSKPKEQPGCEEVTAAGGGSGIIYKIIEDTSIITPGEDEIMTVSTTITMERVEKLKKPK